MIIHRKNIVFKNDSRLHMLRHFQNLDQGYITLLENEHGLIREEINAELKKSGSKFYPHFACNPDECFRRLMNNYFEQDLEPYHGGKRIHIPFSFSEPVGIEGIASESDLNEDELKQVVSGEYRDIEVREVTLDRRIETHEAHIILELEGPQANVLTFFPGKYAPPLPDPELQCDPELHESIEFWKQYVFIRYH
jgi:hypothetical protein